MRFCHASIIVQKVTCSASSSEHKVATSLQYSFLEFNNHIKHPLIEQYLDVILNLSKKQITWQRKCERLLCRTASLRFGAQLQLVIEEACTDLLLTCHLLLPSQCAPYSQSSGCGTGFLLRANSLLWAFLKQPG